MNCIGSTAMHTVAQKKAKKQRAKENKAGGPSTQMEFPEPAKKRQDSSDDSFAIIDNDDFGFAPIG